MIEKYFEKKGDFFYFTGSMLKVYVPLKYIDSPLFDEKENFISVFGIIPVALCDKNGKAQYIEIMNAPYHIQFYNIIYETEKNLSFKDSTPADFRVYTFYTGEKLMRNVIENNNNNLDVFLKYLLNAKIVNYIKYEDLIKAFDKLLMDNNMNLNVPHSVKEVVITSICRNPNKTEELFAMLAGNNPNINQRSYVCLNNRQIVASSSVSTSIAFEDMDSMIISGINATVKGKKLPESPLESILTM